MPNDDETIRDAGELITELRTEVAKLRDQNNALRKVVRDLAVVNLAAACSEVDVVGLQRLIDAGTKVRR